MFSLVRPQNDTWLTPGTDAQFANPLSNRVCQGQRPVAEFRLTECQANKKVVTRQTDVNQMYRASNPVTMETIAKLRRKQVAEKDTEKDTTFGGGINGLLRHSPVL